MAPSPSTTRWRGESIVVTDYDDVARVVALARKARKSAGVEFSWTFGVDALRGLRASAFDWGSRGAGRYKCFDARVLSAINAALGESNTVYVLNEPKSARSMDCSVSWVAEDGLYRLYGHAPFDVVIGYGQRAIDQDPEKRTQLGDLAAATIASAVGMLGWDLHRLAEPRLRPVTNVLYGFPVGHGVGTEPRMLPAPAGSAEATDLLVRFQGPYTAFEEDGYRCLFNDPIADRSGIYLWTVAVADEHRPWYVGQTRRRFGRRIGEHIAAYLSGQYSTSDADSLARGLNSVSWRADDGARWPKTLPSFLSDFEKRAPNLIRMIKLLRFYVAPLDGDAHLHNRIEGALGRYFRAHPDIGLRDLFAPGIRLPSKIPYDTALRLVISSEAPISGMPTHLYA